MELASKLNNARAFVLICINCDVQFIKNLSFFNDSEAAGEFSWQYLGLPWTTIKNKIQ